eukprot:m.299082 g.299082  ORF g.299082 m.299082 type:complete len:56 (-) comp20102_c0_seq9:863-1030(-)
MIRVNHPSLGDEFLSQLPHSFERLSSDTRAMACNCEGHFAAVDPLTCEGHGYQNY